MTKDQSSLPNKVYFLIGVGLFLVEVFIALFVRDSIIRPYGGDFLAVIMLYAFARAIVNWPAIRVAVVVLGIAFAIEIAQYLDLLSWLGWQDNTLAKVVLGSSFEWIDMLAYTLGAVAAHYLDRLLSRRQARA